MKLEYCFRALLSLALFLIVLVMTLGGGNGPR